MSMKKAVIINGNVDNIIICSDEGIKGMSFPIGTTIWDIGQYPVHIGDEFEDGTFYRDGEPLEPDPSDEDRIDEINELLSVLLGGGSNE